MLDVVATMRKHGPYTFCPDLFPAEFKWAEFTQIVARQFGEQSSPDQIQNHCWNEKHLKSMKRNQVTVARQIYYFFMQLWGEAILGGMLLIGQVLNCDKRWEFQNKGIYMPQFM